MIDQELLDRMDLAAWAVTTEQLRPIIAQALEEDGSPVPALLALTTCVSEVISNSAASVEDLEAKLQQFTEMAVKMAREKFLARGNQAGAS